VSLNRQATIQIDLRGKWKSSGSHVEVGIYIGLWFGKYRGTRLENKNTLDGNPDSAQATQDVEVPLKGFLVVRHPRSKG
jgi:hypothetical protein